MATKRRRLDSDLVRRGLVASRQEAQEAINSGLVTVDGAPADKASRQVSPQQQLNVVSPPRRFVSRGGEKLDHALAHFEIDVAGWACLDSGVSTGGFTDCLLQRGAASVVAYDVGYGQVHERLRTDERVTIFERTNIRDVTAADVPGPRPTFVVCDVSFIPLKLVLPVLRDLATEDATAVVLIKPQFEAHRDEVGRGGVVKSLEVRERTIIEVATAAASVGWGGFDVVASPLLGPAGNAEFLAHLSPAPNTDDVAVAAHNAVRAEPERA